MHASAFTDRTTAGRELAEVLAARISGMPLVVALPRGGVPVAAPVAKRLGAPLDVMMVRKIGMPGDEELAIGAVGPDGVAMRNSVATRQVVDGRTFRRLAAGALTELHRRAAEYHAGQPELKLKGRQVVLVDDGLATGITMLVAIRVAREAGAASIIAAAPVASSEACARVREAAEDAVFLRIPAVFESVGQFYERFPQVSDDEVRRLLQEGHAD